MQAPVYFYNFTCPGANLTGPTQFLVARDDWATFSFKHCLLKNYAALLQCSYDFHGQRESVSWIIIRINSLRPGNNFYEKRKWRLFYSIHVGKNKPFNKSLVPRTYCNNSKSVIFRPVLCIDIEHFLWNCPQVNTTELHWWYWWLSGLVQDCNISSALAIKIL